MMGVSEPAPVVTDTQNNNNMGDMMDIFGAGPTTTSTTAPA